MPNAAQTKPKPITKPKKSSAQPVPSTHAIVAKPKPVQKRYRNSSSDVESEEEHPASKKAKPLTKMKQTTKASQSSKTEESKKAKKIGIRKLPSPPVTSDRDDLEDANDDYEDEEDTSAVKSDSSDDNDGRVGGDTVKIKSSDNDDSDEPVQPKAKASRTKQKRYKVLQQITSEDGKAPEKRKENLEECIKILSDAHKWGKLMPRAINLWVDPEDVLLEGIEHSLGSDSSSDKGPNIHAYEILTSLWSIDLSSDLEYFVDADDGISKICTAVHKGFKAGHQEDTHKIREAILKIIVKDPRKETLSIPVPVIKPAQGFNYFETARLLCPQNYLETFDSDDKWRQQLREGKIRITHWELPSFLFDQSKASLDDDLAGCMEGYVLVRTVKHLLLSDGIPGKTKGPTRPPIAKIYKIKTITGRIIAYGACQARYALSSVDGWTRWDGKFNLAKLYDTIVDMYEDFPEDPWAVQSLAWWNKEIFGNSAGDDDEDEDDMVPPPESTVARMAEARRQRQEIHKAARVAADVGDLLRNGGFPFTKPEST
ncbi:uncharacterized protein EV420DRAFT_1735635, partial [Desarmillaria tabescens]